MRNLQEPEQNRPASSKGRKAALIIGIILLCVSVFMGSFVFSFKMILNPADDKSSVEETLTAENKKLKEDVSILQDQFDVVSNELDRYREKYGSALSSASPRPTATTKPTSTPKPTATPKPRSNNDDSSSGSSNTNRSSENSDAMPGKSYNSSGSRTTSGGSVGSGSSSKPDSGSASEDNGGEEEDTGGGSGSGRGTTGTED